MRSRQVLMQRLRAFAQHEFLDLAGRVLRQLAEHDALRRLEVRERRRARARSARRRSPCAPGLSVTNATGHLAPLRVGPGDDRGFEHRRVRRERALDLDRRDVLAARDDDVLGAVPDLDVAVGMHHREVAGAEPAVGRGLARRVVVAVVAEHHVVAAQRDLAERRRRRPARRCRCASTTRSCLRDDVADALARLELRLLAGGQRAPLRTPVADRPPGRTSR